MTATPTRARRGTETARYPLRPPSEAITLTSLLRRLLEVPRGLWLTLGVTMVALGSGVWLAGTLEIPLSALVRDPAAIAKHPFYFGFFSNLGVVIWAGTTGCLLAGGLALRRHGDTDRRGAFLLWFGAVTLVLLLDDLYMIHEDVYRRLLPGPSQVPIALYAALLGVGLLAFREHLWQSAWGPLALSFVFLGISVGIDALIRQPTPLEHYLEDAAKLLGIVAWAWYFGSETVRALAPAR